MGDLIIAKIDATENEVPNVIIKGFPTIKLYKKGEKDSPVEFGDDRTEEGIIKFLKENVSYEWVDSDSTIDID